MANASPNPTVTVGMPVYNGERFIRDALDSLLAQTFTDFELLISDNASTDCTPAICAEYEARDPRIRCVRQSENIGAEANFKFVMNEARGEYFMWAACDDFESSPDYLMELVTAINKGDYGLVFPAVRSIHTESDGVSHDLKANAMHMFEQCRSREDYCVKSIFMPVFQIYGLFRRSLLIDSFWYIERLGLWGDHYFVQAVTANMPICYVPAAVKIYREHKGQTNKGLRLPKVLSSYLRYSWFCVRLWLGEAKVSPRTRLRVLMAISYWHGRKTAAFTLHLLKYLARGALQRFGRRVPESNRA